MGDDLPSFIPLKALNINQDSLQLYDGKSRMSIVQLDGDVIRKCGPGLACFFEAANNVEKRSRAPKVLLLQTQLFATIQVIIGVQDRRYRFSTLLVSNRALVFSVVEFLEIKFPA